MLVDWPTDNVTAAASVSVTDPATVSAACERQSPLLLLAVLTHLHPIVGEFILHPTVSLATSLLADDSYLAHLLHKVGSPHNSTQHTHARTHSSH